MISTVTTPRKTKVAIIREEYISITDRFEQALILNQFIYWTERVNDFDQFIEEENRKKDIHGLQEEMQELTHGWIYKTASKLSDELMTGWSNATTGRHLKALIDKGYIEVRQNPKYKWNQTRQYRVNLNLVQEDLHKNGYSLPGFTNAPIQLSNEKSPIFKMKIQESEMKNVPIIETIKNDVRKPESSSESSPPPEPQQTSSSFSSSENNKTTTADVKQTDEDIQIDDLLKLIPEDMRKPSIENKIKQAVAAGIALEIIKGCIMYSNDQSDKKTWQRYRSHLGKCIDNQWGEGYTQDAGKENQAQAFLESRRLMPDSVLKLDAARGCKISAQVLKERGNAN